jgi:hypothetical protein
MPAVTSTFGLLDRLQKGDREAFACCSTSKPPAGVLVHTGSWNCAFEIDDVLQEVSSRFRDIGKFCTACRELHELLDDCRHVIVDLAAFTGASSGRPSKLCHFAARAIRDRAGGQPDPSGSRGTKVDMLIEKPGACR